MRWLDGDSEMKFFSKEREKTQYDEVNKYKEFSLYNVRTGTIFCRLRIYDGSYEIETLEFFDEIKDELYTLMTRDLVCEKAYSYDRWILPLFRNKKLEKLIK